VLKLMADKASARASPRRTRAHAVEPRLAQIDAAARRIIERCRAEFSQPRAASVSRRSRIDDATMPAHRT
jgi:hypothetical protein